MYQQSFTQVLCNGISGVGLTKKQDWQNDCMTDWWTGQKHQTGIPRNLVDLGIKFQVTTGLVYNYLWPS